jgi:hypothetical protein
MVSTRLDKCDAFHEDWLWLDAQKDVNFGWYAAVDNELATHGISSIDALCDVPEGGNIHGEKREMKVTFKQWRVLPEPILLTIVSSHLHALP